MLSIVHPQPTQPEKRESPSGVDVGRAILDRHLYKDDAVEPLKSIDISRTLAAQLCGRGDDAAFNAKVIAFTRRAQPLMNLIAIVYLPSVMSLFFVSDVVARNAMGYVTAATGACVFVNVAASLSWDMMCLLMGTFEFWFLFFINLGNDILWNMLFHDGRMAGFTASGANFAISLCFDANIYTRRFVTRILVFGSPGLLAGVVLTTLQYPADLHYKTFAVFGVTIDSMDLLVSGNLIITYFTALRVLRSQHLVFSKAPIRSIKCDMYHPECHLVLHSQPLIAEEASDMITTARRLSFQGHASAIRQLKLLQSSSSRDIDVDLVLWPRLARSISLPKAWLTGLGVLSHVSTLVYSQRVLASISNPNDPRYHDASSTFSSVLVGLSSAITTIVLLVYIVSCQRQLALRICCELDAWFVSFQLSMITIGVCDIVQWEWHRTLLLFTYWGWCHWILLLDAVPPPTRRRLHYSSVFALITTALLVLYPILLAYALYFSPTNWKGRDRVIVELDLGRVQWRIKLLGFLASKLFTLEVWMLRIFWRQLLRPANAFKLIKRRVFYQVPQA